MLAWCLPHACASGEAEDALSTERELTASCGVDLCALFWHACDLERYTNVERDYNIFTLLLAIVDGDVPQLPQVYSPDFRWVTRHCFVLFCTRA
jgi:hypothetical protein